MLRWIRQDVRSVEGRRLRRTNRVRFFSRFGSKQYTFCASTISRMTGRLTCNNCGLLNEQQLTQSQVVTTFDAKLVGRQAGSGHAVHTKRSKALGDNEKYHRHPKITPQVCLEAMQWMMKRQASELIKTMSCDKDITQRLKLFWFRFLDCLLSSCSNKVQERRRLFQFFKISKKLSSTSSSSSSSDEDDEEEEKDEEETQSRSRRKTWSMHGFRTSLYLLYLACRDMSEPVLLSDIFRACCRGKITYVAAYHSFPLSLRWRCIGALDFFCPSSSKYGFFQYLEYEWKQCMILRDALFVDKSSLLYRGCTFCSLTHQSSHKEKTNNSFERYELGPLGNSIGTCSGIRR